MVSSPIDSHHSGKDKEATARADTWVHLVKRSLSELKGTGAVYVSFPEYRPELVVHLASRLGYQFFDLRREVMTELGWQAHTLPLSVVEERLSRLSQGTGLVVGNVEALLASLSQDARKKWFKHCALREFSSPVLSLVETWICGM